MEIISKKEAIARGLKRYFTGKPCKHGHVVDRLVCDGFCVSCRKERNKAYWEANKDKEKERLSAYRKATKDKINERKKAYREANSDKLNEFARASREKLSSSYVKITLRSQLQLKTNEITQEMIEGKRQVIKARRIAWQINKLIKEGAQDGATGTEY